MIDDKANVQTLHLFHDCVGHVPSRRGVWDILSCLACPLVSPFIFSCLSINYPPFWSSLHFHWQFRTASVLAYCRCLLYSRFEIFA